MNITRFNFASNKSSIVKNLAKSDFLAIDFEMSGVLANNKLRNNSEDSVRDESLESPGNRSPHSLDSI